MKNMERVLKHTAGNERFCASGKKQDSFYFEVLEKMLKFLAIIFF